MKNLLKYAVSGVIAAAFTVMLHLLLSQQHVLDGLGYAGFNDFKLEGLHSLARICLVGAAAAAVYGVLLKAILPSGWLLGSLSLAVVATLVRALAVPLYQKAQSGPVAQPGPLAWIFLHWFLFALCLLFLVGGKGARDKGEV